MMRQVLYTKLFIVMGIAWIFECVHHLVHSDHQHCGHTGLELIFRLIGCLNLLRGSLIFFIFVCKDSILDKVCWQAKVSRQSVYPLDNVTSNIPSIGRIVASAGFPASRGATTSSRPDRGSNSGLTRD